MDNAENTMQAADMAHKHANHELDAWKASALRLAVEVDKHRHAIEELNGWKGFYLVPRYYCQAAFMPLGKASVKVEYEIVNGQAIVLRALINGMVLDAEEAIPFTALAAWEQELTDAFKRDQSNF
jgi:hypothetical protein